MNREEYLTTLRQELRGLSEKDIQESLDFYSEMIADRMEDGLTEEEAVANMPNPQDAAREIFLDKPLMQVIKAKKSTSEKKKRSGLEIVLLIIGAPLWIPLLIAAAAVVFSVYVSIWAVIVSLFSAVGGIVCFGIASDFYAVHFFIHGSAAQGFFYIGMSLICAGAAILLFFASIAISKQLLKLTKRFGKWLKSLFIGRKEA